MQNKVRRLRNDIIYVQKIGDQTEESLHDLFVEINKLVKDLRAQKKSVLILSNSQKEGKMTINARKMAAAIGQQLDYDKSASFAPSEYVFSVRKIMTRTADLNPKVATFRTRKEAETWLLSK